MTPISAILAHREPVRRRRPRRLRAGRRGTSTSRRSGRRRTGRRRRCATRASCRSGPGWRAPTRPPSRRSRCRTAGRARSGRRWPRTTSRRRSSNPPSPAMVAGHRVGTTEVEHEVVGEDLRQRVVVLAEDRLGHPVDRLDVRVVCTHRSSLACDRAAMRNVRSREAPAHRSNNRFLLEPSAQ